jgi:hypothetical protein
MTGLSVDMPALEVMALVKRLDGHGGMTAAECDAAQRGHERLRQALSGQSVPYESGIETIAESLVGEVVRLEKQDGRVYEGELEKLVGFRTAVVKDEPFSHPVNLSTVKSIAAVRSEVAA